MLVVALVAWVAIPRAAGNALPLLGVIGACAASFVASRLLAGASRSIVPAVVVAGTAGLLASIGRDAWDARPLAGPFGYVNASGAFFAIASVGALMAGSSARGRIIATVGIVAAIAFAAVPVATHVLASAVLLSLLVVPVVALATFATRVARGIIVVCAAIAVVAVAASLALAGGPWRAGAAPLEGVLSGDRIELWREAFRLALSHASFGTGVGTFRWVAVLPRQDPSNLLFWAHNEFLQMAAETGVLGGGLLLAIVIWGFVRLFTVARADTVTALGAVVLAATTVQACVDYVWHFPVVPVAAAALIGTAATREPSP